MHEFKKLSGYLHENVDYYFYANNSCFIFLVDKVEISFEPRSHAKYGKFDFQGTLQIGNRLSTVNKGCRYLEYLPTIYNIYNIYKHI